MMIKPRDRGKSVKYRLSVMVAFVVLLIVSLASNEAKAQACCTVSDPGSTVATTTGSASIVAQLGAVGGIITSVLTFLQNTFPIGFASVSASINASNMTTNNTLYNLGDYTVQGNQYNFHTSLNAQAQAAATLMNQTSACAMSQVGQDMDRLTSSNLLAQAYHAVVGATDCKTQAADCAGPGRALEQLTDLCQLGFIPPGQYGKPSQNCNPPMDPTYNNGDQNLPFLLGTLQMPLATACIQPDGYPFFGPNNPHPCQGGTTQSANYDPDPTKSQLAWVAFFKLVEEMGSFNKTSPVFVNASTTWSANDAAKIMADRSVTTLQLGTSEGFLQALWKRTACPQNNPSISQAIGGTGLGQAVGGSGTPVQDSCYAYQYQLCQDLAGSPNPNGNADVSASAGVGPGSSNTPTYPATSGAGISSDPYLKNCQQNGLSILMAEKILANKCNDANYMSNVLPNIIKDAPELEKFAQSDCETMKNAFKAELRDESSQLTHLMQVAAKLRTMNTALLVRPNPNSQGVGP